MLWKDQDVMKVCKVLLASRRIRNLRIPLFQLLDLASEDMGDLGTPLAARLNRSAPVPE